jgi:hypothetical protein
MVNKFLQSLVKIIGARGSVVIEALGYRPEGSGFENQ